MPATPWVSDSERSVRAGRGTIKFRCKMPDEFWPLFDTSNSTSVIRPDFRLLLPLKWFAANCNDGYHFRNEVLPEELFIRVFPAKAPFEKDARELVLRKLSAIQMDAAQAQSNGESQFRVPQDLSQPDHSETEILGVWPKGGAIFALRIWVYPHKALTASLFRYAGGPETARFEFYARLVLDSLNVI
jgi:hypothetical protein